MFITIKANSILVDIYQEFFATEEQKIMIDKILYENQLVEEKEKREKYSPNNIFINDNEKKESIKIENVEKLESTESLIEYKESFVTKLKNRYTHIDYIQEDNEEIKPENYTLEEQAIINILKENSKVKQEEIAQQIGKSLRTVKSRMIEMQEKGLIKRKNGKRDGEWIINIKNYNYPPV